MRRRVRILFVNCSRLDVEACTYLLLAQNAVQSLFEFEVCHHWIFLAVNGSKANVLSRFWRAWTDVTLRGVNLPGSHFAEKRYSESLERLVYPELRKDLGIGNLTELREIVEAHEEWLASKDGYGGKQGPCATVVVTETPLSGAYISNSVGNLAVVTLSNWRQYIYPQSKIEFVLASVQRLAARVAISNRLGSHYPTRGCVWDFTANVRDFKAGALVGHICDECRPILGEALTQEELDQYSQLVDRRWIGKLEDVGSVASNLKRVYGYDLSITRGVTPSFLDRIVQIMWSPETLKVLYALLTALALWIFAKRGVIIQVPK